MVMYGPYNFVRLSRSAVNPSSSRHPLSTACFGVYFLPSRLPLLSFSAFSFEQFGCSFSFSSLLLLSSRSASRCVSVWLSYQWIVGWKREREREKERGQSDHRKEGVCGAASWLDLRLTHLAPDQPSLTSLTFLKHSSHFRPLLAILDGSHVRTRRLSEDYFQRGKAWSTTSPNPTFLEGCDQVFAKNARERYVPSLLLLTGRDLVVPWWARFVLEAARPGPHGDSFFFVFEDVVLSS